MVFPTLSWVSSLKKTNSKWGKSRPWILWMSLPFAISIVLIYTVPQTSSALQFAYIFVTYNLCTTVCYTALNLPYGSLSAMMTRISKERDMLSIVRMSLSPLGKILAVSATLPLVKFRRQPDGVGSGYVHLGISRFPAPAALLLEM